MVLSSIESEVFMPPRIWAGEGYSDDTISAYLIAVYLMHELDKQGH